MGGPGIPIPPRRIEELAERWGGVLRNGAGGTVRRLAKLDVAEAFDLAPLFDARYLDDAALALGRGALLLVDESLASRPDIGKLPGWFHPFGGWALAELLDLAETTDSPPDIDPTAIIGPGAIVLPRVKIGARVVIGPGAVIGAAGFGFATGKSGVPRRIPQLGGVVIEDDVHVGALSTIASGTLGPTVLRRGVKLDDQVHIAHNCEIGEGTVIAAQTGIAGSVFVGRGVLMGGQVGVADHLRIGDGARIAAKSGVIGDIAPGTTVAGYPAVERQRWLRGLAELYRLVSHRASKDPAGGLRPTPSVVPPSVASSDPSTVAMAAVTLPTNPNVPSIPGGSGIPAAPRTRSNVAGLRPEAIIRSPKLTPAAGISSESPASTRPPAGTASPPKEKP